MSHTFSISSAKYDGTTSETNPDLIVIGTVDGVEFPFSITWHAVQTANSSGGVAAVRLVMGPTMLNSVVINRVIPAVPQQPIPIFYGNVPAPAAAAVANGWLDVPEVLNCGSWSA